MSIQHTLIVGAGPAAIQTAVAVSKSWEGEMSLVNHNSSYSREVKNQLEKSENVITAIAPNRPSLSGKVKITRFYDGFATVEDRFDVMILCVPSYSYHDVLQALRIEKLTQLKTIILLSPVVGSNEHVSNLVHDSGRSIELISLSTYFAATKFVPDGNLVSFTKAVKKRIYLATNKKTGRDLRLIEKLLAEAGIETVVKENAIDVECRNITTYVHPPFFINPFSLNEIFSEKKSLKSLYKLYPEGPITQETIRMMVKLWKEISALVVELGGNPINLLQFLNDDNYPVHDESLSRSDLDRFCEVESVKQEYLLYIRYASILIDPFSKPNKNGAYFDFSKVPYKQISRTESGEWRVPRIPFEDYKNLKQMHRMGVEKGISMPEIVRLIQLFERKAHEWQYLKGERITGMRSEQRVKV
ncbi:opine metallophore biosynthesis dehydrogenase [Anaerobacillus sp. 1_MG-2023]|uniref:opine metallophore biosynthesis dehydrogenase n=1 Tax=Bacillales TaxID=1385 RepID=UPI0026E19577|nr:opine metallophore biosynthesis dehydrogenase [Anaerobacillus sp. 1_MG-2023]MDO6654482.1 opine metallophore biosynthesis dehydrogenase [Anaerobacillus sp. 1_MG-2023]